MQSFRRSAIPVSVLSIALLGLIGCATGPGFGVEQRAENANPPVQTAPGQGQSTENAGTRTVGGVPVPAQEQGSQSQVQLYDDMAALRREVQRLQSVVEEQQQSLDQSEQRNRELYDALEARLKSPEPITDQRGLDQQILNQRTREQRPLQQGTLEQGPLEQRSVGQTGLPDQQGGIENRTVVGSTVGDDARNADANSSILRNTETEVVGTGAGTFNNGTFNNQQPVTTTAGTTSVNTGNRDADEIIRQANTAQLPTTTTDDSGETVIIGTTAGTVSGAQGSAQGIPQNAEQGVTGGQNDAGLRVVTIPAANPDQPTTTTGSVVGGTTAREQLPATPAAQASYDAALDLLKQSRFNDAIAAFEDMLSRHGDTDLADDATFWVSEARYVSRDFAPALAGYQTVLNEFPSSERVPESLLKIGVIQAEMGAVEDARKTYQMVMDRFPGSRVAVSAQGRLQRISN